MVNNFALMYITIRSYDADVIRPEVLVLAPSAFRIILKHRPMSLVPVAPPVTALISLNVRGTDC